MIKTIFFLNILLLKFETLNQEEDMLTEEDEEFMNNMADEPGKDSGCTSVVALIRDNVLYVANAGKIFI